MFFKKIAFISLLVALTGCAAPQVPITKLAQSNMERVEGVLVIPQSNLDVSVQATNPGNTGLIGALIASAIDSARQSSAEKDAAQILEPIRNYDFRAVMLSASNDALGKIDAVKFALPLRVEVVASDSATRIAFDQSAASAILFCNIRYRLESGNMIVTANAEIYPKAHALKQFRNKANETNPVDAGNVIYRRNFTFTKEAITAATVKEALDEATKNIADQLAADINHGI
jgi:hypothetical protein